jgi:single-strand DNA-binding protein
MINKVILIGNLGANPEIKVFTNFTVVNFSVATTENYKDKDGEWQNNTEWHKVSAFGFAAKSAEKLCKGDQVYIEGSLKTDKWQDKDGNTRYSTGVKANLVRKLGKKERSGDREENHDENHDEGVPPHYNSGDVPF